MIYVIYTLENSETRKVATLCDIEYKNGYCVVGFTGDFPNISKKMHTDVYDDLLIHLFHTTAPPFYNIGAGWNELLVDNVVK